MSADPAPVAVRFDAAAHRYWLGGVELPSVTTVLRALGLLNFGGASGESMERGRDRGDRVHLATELNDRNDLDEGSIDEEVAGYLAGWRRFVAECEFECEAIETLVHHPRYQYAGTLDRRGSLRYPGQRQRWRAIVDIKTGAPQRATGYQLAAYNACEFAPREALRKRVGVYLTPDGRYRAQAYDDPHDLGIFLAALTVFNARKDCGA